MDLRRHLFIHAGDLHLVIEIGAVTQATDHDGGAVLLRRGDGELVVGGRVKGAAGLGCNRLEHVPHHLEPLLDRKQRRFAGVKPNGDDQPVAQGDRMPDDVQMAVGDGIERAWIQRNAGHDPSYRAPGSPASRMGCCRTGCYFFGACRPLNLPHVFYGKAGFVSSRMGPRNKTPAR